MLSVGLTGGIGAGKSTFAALLAERGAQVLDADQFGRDALAPGRPAWHSVVSQFGDEILAAGGMAIDRKKLAGIVFNDRRKLAALNAIVHPVIVQRIADELERLARTDAVVIVDAALIAELGLRDTFDVVVVVTTNREQRVERLVRTRGMTLDDIHARIGAQASNEELEAQADYVVRNDGDLDALAAEADRVWALLQERA
ncbi:MAG TPA: dephospho-CoA kinase [Actinomycetota bacterium]|nr:dephospho-CoA kinase [Actinomycetota bacterium]